MLLVANVNELALDEIVGEAEGAERADKDGKEDDESIVEAAHVSEQIPHTVPGPGLDLQVAVKLQLDLNGEVSSFILRRFGLSKNFDFTFFGC